MRSFEELKYFRLKLSLATIPVACAALYAGIHLAGLVGAITAYVTVQTLDLAVLIGAIGRKLRMSPGDLRRLTPVLRTLIAASVAGLATFGVKLALAGAYTFVMLAVCSLVYGTVYLIGTFITGAVTKSEKAELRGALMGFYRLGSRRLGISAAR